MIYDPQTHELFTVKGEDPDPMGTGLVGKSSQINLDRTALAHPLVRLAKPVGEIAFIEVDIYAADVEGLGGAPGLEILLLCPRCRNQLRITSDRKHVDFEPGAAELDPHTGRSLVRGKLSVETFRCTWELEAGNPAAHIKSPFGTSLCRYQVAIDRNVAKEA